MRVHWLQHAEHEGLGCIAPWLLARGHRVQCSALHRDDPLPAIGDFDWLIAMGGPMNIYQTETYPWLAQEPALLAQASTAGKAVLGICLGAQLLAEGFGAPTTRNAHPEIGFHPVHLTDEGLEHPLLTGLPEVFDAFHWHGDTFAIPAGSSNLLHSNACAHQAFAIGGKTLGLQFHLEVTAADARRWFVEEIPQPAEWVQTPEEILANLPAFAANNAALYRILASMEAACVS